MVTLSINPVSCDSRIYAFSVKLYAYPGSESWYAPGKDTKELPDGTPVPLPVTLICAHSG